MRLIWLLICVIIFYIALCLYNYLNSTGNKIIYTGCRVGDHINLCPTLTHWFSETGEWSFFHQNSYITVENNRIKEARIELDTSKLGAVAQFYQINIIKDDKCINAYVNCKDTIKQINNELSKDSACKKINFKCISKMHKENSSDSGGIQVKLSLQRSGYFYLIVK